MTTDVSVIDDETIYFRGNIPQDAVMRGMFFPGPFRVSQNLKELFPRDFDVMKGSDIQAFVDVSSMFRHDKGVMSSWGKNIISTVDTDDIYHVLNKVKNDNTYGAHFGRVAFAKQVLSLMSSGMTEHAAEKFLNVGGITGDRERFVATELVKLYLSFTGEKSELQKNAFSHIFLDNGALDIHYFTQDSVVHKVFSVLPIVFDDTGCLRAMMKTPADSVVTSLSAIDTTGSRGSVINSMVITMEYPDMAEHITKLPLRWNAMQIARTSRQGAMLAFFMGAVSPKHEAVFNAHMPTITAAMNDLVGSRDSRGDAYLPLESFVSQSRQDNHKDRHFLSTLPVNMMFYLMERCGDDVNTLVKVMEWVVKIPIATENDFFTLVTVIDNLDIIDGLPMEWVMPIIGRGETQDVETE